MHLEMRDSYMCDDPEFIRRQGGHRYDPADRESWWHWWGEQGRTGFERFGLTVDGDGERVWLDGPGSPAGKGPALRAGTSPSGPPHAGHDPVNVSRGGRRGSR